MNIQTIFENNTVYNIDYTEFADKNELQNYFLTKGSADAGLIIFYQSDNGISDELTLMLTNMMKAVKINMENVLMVDVRNKLKFSNIRSLTSFSKCIVFGVPLSSLSLQISAKPYTITQFNGVEILFAESLEIINGDKQRKIALWQLLQKFFKID